MRGLRGSGEYELEARRSRFVGAVAPVGSEEAARAFVAGRRAAHPGARHHCFAYVIADPPAERASDDGEPSGTGGAPILEVLKKRELSGAVAVVSRHFGGILLGAGGLIRAYGTAAARAVDAAGEATLVPYAIMAITVDYDLAGRLENELRAAYRVRDARYETKVTVEASIPEREIPTFHAWLADTTAGAATAQHLATEYRIRDR